MSTPDCCDKLPDFTVQSIVNNFCIPPTTTTTTTTTSTTLPPNFCFDNIVFDNLTTTVGTIIGTESGTTWTAGDGISNINFIFQIPEKTFAEFWQASNGLSSLFIINEILIINIPTLLSGQYKLIEKTVFNFGGTYVIKHKFICNTTTTTGTTTTGTTTTGTTTTGTTTTGTTTTGTTTTGTTTTGTTTTGTTTTGTTTTGTTTTGTTTTCAPWPPLPCLSASCSYITEYTIDGLIFEAGEAQQYIVENPCYSGEEILAIQSPCSEFDCLWVSVYDGNNPPAWQFVTGACEAWNNNCNGNCGTCNFPSELPPLEDGIYTSTKCSCVS
jgi:hypothetical protein